MHSIIWILALVLGPPFVAYFAWLGIGSRTGNIDPWKSVRLGKYGYWITLGIIYTVAIATAMVEHKI
jgi:hypothetical protein